MSEKFSFLFTGDFAPCFRYQDLLLSKGINIFGELQNDIASADIAFVNLETPLCHSNRRIKKIGPNLKAHPDCALTLTEAGFDLVGLANNHIMDYGVLGLEETIDACKKSGLHVCGAGLNLAEAQKPIVIEKKGLIVAIIAIAENEFSIATRDNPGASPLDAIDNSSQIEKARKVADLVFVTIHGGNEYFSYPRPGLRKFCKFLIDRGADAVVCHHPHVPGAYEIYKKKPIVYSLGNLIFDHIKPPIGWNKGYAIRLEYCTDAKQLVAHKIIPYTQSVSQGGVRKMLPKELSAFLDQLSAYSQTLKDDTAYEKKWADFCEDNEALVLTMMFFPFRIRGVSKLSKIIPFKKLILTNSTIPYKKNILSCESHRELLMRVLENHLK